METTKILTRSIDVITGEIISIRDQTKRVFYSAVIEIGKRLIEAKEQVPQGEWTGYLTNVLELKPSTAQNYMRIAREFGSDQIALSGKAMDELFSGLSYSQLLPLVGLPDEERRELAEQNELDGMTSREIEKLVSDYKAARAAEAHMQRQIQALEEAKEKADKAAAKAEAAEERERTARDAAEAKARELDGRVKELMEAAKATPIEASVVPDEEVLERERQKVREEQAAALKAAEARAAEVEEKLQRAKNPAAVKVNFLFGEMQTIIDRITGALDELRVDNPEAANKFALAIGIYAKKVLGGWSEDA